MLISGTLERPTINLTCKCGAEPLFSALESKGLISQGDLFCESCKPLNIRLYPAVPAAPSAVDR